MSWEYLRYYELAALMNPEIIVSEFWSLFLTWGSAACLVLMLVVLWDAWRK